MIDKIVKIRKKRKCIACEKQYSVGDAMRFQSLRSPRYDPGDEIDFDGEQIGIKYHKFWLCEDTDACNRRIRSE